MPIDIAAYQNLIAQITSATVPPGPVSQCNWVPSAVGAHIAARGILYAGSCSGSGAIQSAQEATIVTNLATSLANIPGVGSILDAIFAHHAQAVQTEDETVCHVVQIANQAIPAIDNAVASGQITPQAGITAFTQLVSQLKGILAPISGQGSSGNPCNAGCCYQHLMDAHLLFVQSWYPDIYPGAPMPVAPAQPSNYATVSVPQAQANVSYAGVTGVLPVLYNSLGQIVGAPSTLQAPSQQPTQIFGSQGPAVLAPVVSGISGTTLLLFAAVAIVGIILLLRG